MARLVKLTGTGPLKIEPSDKPVFVCTCGLSRKFPFCDGTHKACRDEPEGQTFVYDEQAQRHPAPKA
jgi:CDGSH-type Zn-finger protein